MSAALTDWPRNDAVTAPKVTFFLEFKLTPERVREMCTVKDTPASVPLTSARGRLEGAEEPCFGAAATVPLPTLGRPRAEPLMEVMVLLTPPFPVHVTVAVPF